jgi:sulfite exporter TauE/SafE
MILIWTAISLGFLGSFHCVGMCGPIALALPIGKQNPTNRLLSILIYNSGRILTYSAFGILFGAIGKSFSLFGYQQLLSIVLGALILFGLLIPKKLLSKINLGSFVYYFFNKLKTKLATLFLKEEKKSLFAIGLLNGLLPCGLVYMAAAGAIATGNILNGALFMAFFGMGTLPAMMALSLTGNKLSVTFRGKIRKAMPYALGFMACLLILRGLNLDIPYVSPKMKTNSGIPTCHPKTAHKICRPN